MPFLVWLSGVLAVGGSGLPMWGNAGHQIVCEIAYMEASETSRTRIRELIAGDDFYTRFADACLWADHVRTQARNGVASYQPFAYLNDAHFVNSPRAASTVDATSCTRTVSGVRRPCVIDAITEFRDSLRSVSTAARRLEALKFLAHFVGDVHQPLHAGYREDGGGNADTVGVEPSGRMSLHAIWDSHLVARSNRPWRTYALELQRDINPVDRTAWSNLDPRIWAEESYQIVEDVVYENLARSPQGQRIADTRYYHLNQITVERRLKQAGVRLARMLDAAFDPPPPNVP